jgi:hypothetical protein
MILISHRGNLFGSIKEEENHPKKIEEVISRGFNCEIDLWVHKKKNRTYSYYLGHETGLYEIEENWIKEFKKSLWIHCKNTLALEVLASSGANFNFFWHQTDDYTVTSHGIIWVYPGREVPPRGILVLPELGKNSFSDIKSLNIAGVCSDFIGELL